MKDYLDITQLVRSIQKADDQDPCFRDSSSEDCPETDCEWRAYCLEEKSCRLQSDSERAGDCWSPPVTVLEKDELIRVEAEIPGLEIDDIQLRIHGNLFRNRVRHRHQPLPAGGGCRAPEKGIKKTIKHLDPAAIRRLITKPGGWCVSLYMPSGQNFMQAGRNRIRFKNLLREAEERLVALGVRPPEVAAWLGPARALLPQRPF